IFPLTRTLFEPMTAFATGLVMVIDVAVTETVTGADVVVPPRSSTARAVRVCAPAGTFVSVASYVAVVVVASTTPLRRKSTRTILPSESLALAATWIEAGAEYGVPLVGLVIATVGGKFAGGE